MRVKTNLRYGNAFYTAMSALFLALFVLNVYTQPGVVQHASG